MRKIATVRGFRDSLARIDVPELRDRLIQAVDDELAGVL